MLNESPCACVFVIRASGNYKENVCKIWNKVIGRFDVKLLIKYYVFIIIICCSFKIVRDAQFAHFVVVFAPMNVLRFGWVGDANFTLQLLMADLTPCSITLSQPLCRSIKTNTRINKQCNYLTLNKWIGLKPAKISNIFGKSHNSPYF